MENSHIVKNNEMTENGLLLEIGIGLIPLVDKNKGEAILLKNILALRQDYPDVPRIHIVDNIRFKENEFRIKDFHCVISEEKTTPEDQAQEIIEVLKKMYS